MTGDGYSLTCRADPRPHRLVHCTCLLLTKADINNIGSMNEDVSKFLESRLGRAHAKLRLGIEAEHEPKYLGRA